MAYLKQKKPTDYWNYEEAELDKALGKFWFEAKTKKGEKYTASSLWHLRYGLNRGLNHCGNTYNIITLASFSDSQSKFNDACALLKSIGKGYVEHFKEIKPSGSGGSRISRWGGAPIYRSEPCRLRCTFIVIFTLFYINTNNCITLHSFIYLLVSLRF